ncbi:MAG: CotH kinase family protein [Deltaproteobacteria bacterium]|nr:CotH kinase family protein [Deltaproteobacteria bacterium]
MTRDQRGRLTLLICLIAIGAAGWAAHRWTLLDPLRTAGQRRQVTPEELGSGRLARSLQQLSKLQPRPYDPQLEADSPRSGRKDPVGWSVETWNLDDYPSSQGIPPQLVAQGLNIVSIAVRPIDLKAIEKQPRGRGQESERPAYVSLFTDKELTFASGVGIRLHGGLSRIHSPVKSYRLYFHRNYGATEIPSSVLHWPHRRPADRLVLHNDVRQDFAQQDWHFNSPLAYDISRRLGAWAPHTLPALFYLNGQRQGIYFLTERIDEKFLIDHFGHDDFVFLRTKRDRGDSRFRKGDRSLFKEIRQWETQQRPLTLESVEKRIETENLFSWALSILFCATTDPFQGSLLRDQTDPESRWFWINWDMDHSFMAAKGKTAGPANEDTFRSLFTGRHPDLRARLLRRLAQEDPKFQSAFADRFSEALNHQLTDDFLAQRLAFYRQVAKNYHLQDREFLDSLRIFLKRRKNVLRRQFLRTFPGGDSYRLRVIVPAGSRVVVDGYPYSEDYVGWYFTGQRAVLEIGEEAEGFSHWEVSGPGTGRRTSSSARTLRLEAQDNLTVEAIFVNDENR